MVLAVSWLLCCALLSWSTLAMRADYLAHLRRETVDMFYHGFSNYMLHAFPDDEVGAWLLVSDWLLYGADK